MMQTSEDMGTNVGAVTTDKPFGPVAAVFLAAGIGALVLGILTTISEASADFASALQWSDAVGPLAGKTILAVTAFVLSWVVLTALLRGKDPTPRTVFLWAGILVVAGLVLTFPTFFQTFAPKE